MLPTGNKCRNETREKINVAREINVELSFKR
jgi:hypothetical protein